MLRRERRSGQGRVLVTRPRVASRWATLSRRRSFPDVLSFQSLNKRLVELPVAQCAHGTHTLVTASTMRPRRSTIACSSQARTVRFSRRFTKLTDSYRLRAIKIRAAANPNVRGHQRSRRGDSNRGRHHSEISSLRSTGRVVEPNRQLRSAPCATRVPRIGTGEGEGVEAGPRPQAERLGDGALGDEHRRGPIRDLR